MSFMVQNSVAIGKPIIGVSINYRLSAWGFLFSREVTGSGDTNLGLRDQRLALHWVKENIDGFGGISPDIGAPSGSLLTLCRRSREGDHFR
jgi:carboxylesterase type B